MKKVLATTVNGYGENVPTAVLFQESGLLYLWEVNCYSAIDLGLGTCLCNNHPMATETPVSTAEVIQQFGEEALNGFEAPSDKQLIFNAFGIEADELETYLKVSYRLGINPLPALRDASGQAIVFSHDPDRLIFPEEEPGTIVFIVNSRGEISVREAYEPQPVYEVEADDPGDAELAIPGFE